MENWSGCKNNGCKVKEQGRQSLLPLSPVCLGALATSRSRNRLGYAGLCLGMWELGEEISFKKKTTKKIHKAGHLHFGPLIPGSFSSK